MALYKYSLYENCFGISSYGGIAMILVLSNKLFLFVFSAFWNKLKKFFYISTAKIEQFDANAIFVAVEREVEACNCFYKLMGLQCFVL